MNLAENWAKVFVVITFLIFGEVKLLVESFQSEFVWIFLVVIGFFALKSKMAEMFSWKKQN